MSDDIFSIYLKASAMNKKRKQVEQKPNVEELEKFIKWFFKDFQMWSLKTIYATYDYDEIIALYIKSLENE